MNPEQDAEDHGPPPTKKSNGNLGRLKLAGAILTVLGIALFAYFIYSVGFSELIGGISRFGTVVSFRSELL